MSVDYSQDLVRRLLEHEEVAYSEFSQMFASALRRYYLNRGLSERDASDLSVTVVTDVAMRVGSLCGEDTQSLQAWFF